MQDKNTMEFMQSFFSTSRAMRTADRTIMRLANREYDDDWEKKELAFCIARLYNVVKTKKIDYDSLNDGQKDFLFHRILREKKAKKGN